jgi:CubicO group peptidase (beta-lactamase class C family)
MTVAISGTCESGFEAVRDELARNFAERDEVGAAVCVMVDGRTVVDLWGGVADPATDRPWEADTRVVVYSCTKGATALCAHILADRGRLDLDAPVAEYWPEFATNGKEDVIVSMMLDHSVGVPALAGELQPGAMYDWDLMCGLLAQQEPWWEPGTRNGYHVITFGWTVGELVRRVSGRSLGTFFREEVAGPLGLEFDIGLPEELEPTVAPITVWVPEAGYDSSFTRAIRAAPAGVSAMAMKNMMNSRTNPNTRAYRAAELGGGGGVATARGLAGMYAPLANGGGSLVGPDTLTRMAQVSTATGDDAVLRIPTRFALGFMKSMDNRRRVPSSGYSAVLSAPAFGHVGAGGSLGFADPEAGMSFGYAMNRQGAGILLNDRGQSLVDAVYRSLGYRTDAGGVWHRPRTAIASRHP